jgi:hypothetical protein
MGARHGEPGTEHSKSFSTKASATQHVRSVLADLHTGIYANPLRSAITFGTVVEEPGELGTIVRTLAYTGTRSAGRLATASSKAADLS